MENIDYAANNNEPIDETQYFNRQDQLDYLQSILSNGEDTKYAFPKEALGIMINALQQTNLARLVCRGTGLNQRIIDESTIKLTEALIASNVQVEEISLPFHRIGDAGFDELCRLLNPSTFQEGESLHLQSIKTLNLEGNDITGEYLNKSLLMTPYDCSVTSLNLSGNALSNKGQDAIAEMIGRNKVLLHLSINSCSLHLQGLIKITSNLRNNQHLESLYLDRPILTTIREGEILEHLSKYLERNHSLESLSLRYHDAVDYDIRLLSNALAVNQHLMYLNLECNKIGVNGAEALASILLYKGTVNCLQFLGLSYNFVADHGAIALAEAIKANTGLRKLTLKNNRIEPVGLAALGQALETSHHLESLLIFGNDFNNENGIQYHSLLTNRLNYLPDFHLDIDVYIVDGQYQIAERSMKKEVFVASNGKAMTMQPE